LDELDEPEAKASLIWIIGEYANSIDNAGELLSIFVDTFTEEAYPVAIQISQLLVVSDQNFAGTIANTDGRRQAILDQA
jgi:vesicle coat complex subunit